MDKGCTRADSDRATASRQAAVPARRERCKSYLDPKKERRQSSEGDDRRAASVDDGLWVWKWLSQMVAAAAAREVVGLSAPEARLSIAQRRPRKNRSGRWPPQARLASQSIRTKSNNCETWLEWQTWILPIWILSVHSNSNRTRADVSPAPPV